MLKKQIILSFFLFSLFVQTNTAQYRFGLSGGLTLSSHVGKDFTDTDFPKIGMSLGFFYEHELNRKLSLLFDPAFVQKGANYTFYPRNDIYVTVNNSFDYFVLPFMLKLNFGVKLNCYLATGLAPGWLLNYKSEVKAYINDFEVPPDPFFPYTYNRFDAGISVGGGIMWKEIFLDVRYVQGTRNIYDADDIPSIRNHMVSVKLAFSLYRKKNLPCYKKI
jgi:hypothetical protein